MKSYFYWTGVGYPIHFPMEHYSFKSPFLCLFARKHCFGTCLHNDLWLEVMYSCRGHSRVLFQLCAWFPLHTDCSICVPWTVDILLNVVTWRYMRTRLIYLSCITVKLSPRAASMLYVSYSLNRGTFLACLRRMDIPFWPQKVQILVAQLGVR